MVGNWLSWQIDYLLAIQNFREFSEHIFDNFFLKITMFGELIIPMLVICLIYWCINKKIGMYLLWNYILAVYVSVLIKMTACIYRPWILSSSVQPLAQAIPNACGYSFPSGHTANAMAVWGGIAVKFWNNCFIRYICIFLIFLVMFSRNYVGVHTPQDVIVGFIMGLGLLYLTYKLMIWESNNIKNNKDLIITGVITILGGLLLLYLNCKSYPVDYVNGKLLFNPQDSINFSFGNIGGLLGIFYGWVIEKRFINFDIEKTSIVKRIIRYIVGIVILSFIMFYGKDFCLETFGNSLGLFLLYLLFGLNITAISPYIFKKLNI